MFFLAFFLRNSYFVLFGFVQVLCGVSLQGPALEVGEVSTMADGELVVETCITRTLPPAVTLEKGLRSIKEAVEALKLNPPCTSSGFFRFQV